EEERRARQGGGGGVGALVGEGPPRLGGLPPDDAQDDPGLCPLDLFVGGGRHNEQSVAQPGARAGEARAEARGAGGPRRGVPAARRTAAGSSGRRSRNQAAFRMEAAGVRSSCETMERKSSVSSRALWSAMAACSASWQRTASSASVNGRVVGRQT